MDGLGQIEGQCMVCGDRSAGKHYGVMACYGCKGFFRRTIRSGQAYTCRFVQKCSIDKDQRNACRFCRFQRCLNVGMEPEAIRPDRDIIGKQKNPRRKKQKREDSSLPSPGSDSHMSQQDDALITYLVDVELQATSGAPPMDMSSPIGIARVKSDPDFDLASLFHNKHQLSVDTFDMNYDVGRIASVDQLSQSMRRYVIAAVHWIDMLYNLAHVPSIHEKVCALRSVFAAFSLFSQAARTAQTTSDPDVLCLCNRTIVPRIPPRHLLETNLLANNFTARLLDDLVAPLRKLALNESELVALTALIVLDADAPGLSPSSQAAVSDLRDKVQNALFQLVRERIQPESGLAAVTARFGNILLILPPLAKLSSLVGENVQFAKMFGVQGIDPFLVELFVENPGEVIPSPSTTKDRSDAQTQTQQSTPSLPSPLSTDSHCIGSTASSSDSLPDSIATPIAQHRPPPLVVPSATYNPFFLPYSNAPQNGPPSAPFSAPYTTATGLPNYSNSAVPQQNFFDGSQSADPTRSFRFI